MAKLLLRIWQWLKSRFQNECQPTNRQERRSLQRKRGLRSFAAKFSGIRRYTPAPAIYYTFGTPMWMLKY